MKDDVPPRSRLYHLAPQGAGTPLIESLTSYINRLAWEYRTNPRVLVGQEIAPNLGASYQSSLHNIGHFALFGAISINSNGKVALDWSTTLEKLTKRTDLRHLSVLSWANELPTIGLMRKTPAWCSGCYRVWQNDGSPIYQPLLWMLKIVKICLKHGQSLEEQCPHCQKQQAFFASTVIPVGHCTHCRSWLGTISKREADVEIDDETFAWQKWAMSMIEELRVASNSSETIPWRNFRFGLSACRQILGGTKQLVQLADVPEISLSRWITGKVMPSLESLLKLCYVLDLSPLQIMKSSSSTLEAATMAKKAIRLPRPKNPAPLAQKQGNILEFIQSVLEGREVPHSIRQVERRFDLGKHTLKYHYPQEATLVAAQYRAYRKEKARQRVEIIIDEVRTAAFSLHTQGIYPSQARVSRMLSDPNWMIMSETRTALHAVQRELRLKE